ncbi:hypothetical protein Pelo_11152 [Pelomyxa schiedti]|nr:hypothetical protein Pelo_11152 [Pelomyxa schiedti]
MSPHRNFPPQWHSTALSFLWLFHMHVRIPNDISSAQQQTPNPPPSLTQQASPTCPWPPTM